MDDEVFDKDLLISLIDGLGYFSEETLRYQKNRDTLGALHANIDASLLIPELRH